jgi:TfoX-like protein
MDLAERVRAALRGRRGVSEKKMFGGVCFMLRDHMLCGTGSGRFMFRVGKENDAAALERPGASAMAFNGRRYVGFVWVDAGCDARSLRRWLDMAESYVTTLPPKRKRK